VTTPPSGAPHVVVLGGGLAGVACAHRLGDEGIRVTLVDRNDYHQFQPLLYQVATSQLPAEDIARPHRTIFREHPTVEIRSVEVTGVDADAHRVTLADGDAVTGSGRSDRPPDARVPSSLAVMSPVRAWLQRSLWDVVPRDHRESSSALRRRQLVTLGFVVLGAVVLGLSLRIEPGSVWFYPATFGLALVWVVGAFASGPLHLGRIAYRDELVRPWATPIALGLALAGLFMVGALVVRDLPYLGDRVAAVLDYADEGTLPLLVVITAVNGVAEELFFRGAAYAAVTRRPVLWTTVGYVAATLATGNVMLAFAALLLAVVVGLERRASGGVLAPILTHVTWSLTMLVALPALFG
jgi:uncharacterized protein